MSNHFKISCKRLIIYLTILLLFVVALICMNTSDAYAEEYPFKFVNLTHVKSPAEAAKLTEYDSYKDLSHLQVKLGEAEWEYIMFRIEKTSWVGFERVYNSDYDVAGGARATDFTLCKDAQLQDSIYYHNLTFKALLEPGTYYAAIRCCGSYDFYGWYMPCEDVITEAEMIYLAEDASYMRITYPESSREAKFYISELPKYPNGINYAAYMDNPQVEQASKQYDPENHQFKYKSKVYDLDTSKLSHFPIDPEKQYYAHVYYSNSTDGVDDQWTTWNFFVPIKLKDLSHKLPKGFTFEDNEIYYSVLTSNKTKTLEVTGFDYGTTIKIPATVTKNGDKYKVVKIADKAFKGSDLSTIAMGSNVKSIGKSAFSNCKSLIEVKIGKNVTTIGQNAFYKCPELTSITIPAKVSKIGKSAFRNCKKLDNITIKSKKLKSSTVDANAFKDVNKYCGVSVPKAKLKAYKKLLRSKGLPKKASLYY